MHSSSELVAGTVDLVSLPRAYFRVRELINQPDVCAAQIAEVVSTDPVMTMRLLRIANSAYFGFISEVETVQRAISMLGNTQVHDLALAVSAVGSFTKLETDLINITEFWRRGVHCAVLSRMLGERSRHGERLFVAGLLHHVGQLVLCHQLPEQQAQAISQSEEERRPLFQVEREIYGFDYAEVGANLLRAWGLPDSLQTAVGFHTEPSRTEEHVLESSIVHVASILSQAHVATDELSETVPHFETVAFQVAGLEEIDVQEILAKADAETLALATSLLP
jgi:HD-like signal output (HDOD) protein